MTLHLLQSYIPQNTFRPNHKYPYSLSSIFELATNQLP